MLTTILDGAAGGVCLQSAALGKYGPNCRTFQQKGETAGMMTNKGDGTNKNGSSELGIYEPDISDTSLTGRAALLPDADAAAGERRPPQRHRPPQRQRQQRPRCRQRRAAADAVGRRPRLGRLRRPRPPLLGLHQVHRPLGEWRLQSLLVREGNKRKLTGH